MEHTNTNTNTNKWNRKGSATFIRKTNRLIHEKFYTGNNWYFVTICTHKKQNLLVAEPLRFQNRFQNSDQFPRFKLNPIGKEVEKLWLDLPNIFSNITLDAFVIMPNHIHFIIGMGEVVFYKNSTKPQSLSDIIAKFKSIAWANVHNNVWTMETASKMIWQKSFYDRVARNENELNRIREYIFNNPIKWEFDEMNKSCLQ